MLIGIITANLPDQIILSYGQLFAPLENAGVQGLHARVEVVEILPQESGRLSVGLLKFPALLLELVDALLAGLLPLGFDVLHLLLDLLQLVVLEIAKHAT